MKSISPLLLILGISLSLVGVKSYGQKTTKDTEIERSLSKFAKQVLKEKLSITNHERVLMGYWDIQMLFEADDFRSDHFNSYISYSAGKGFDKSLDGNYEGVILFAVPYKDVQSAEHAFQVLKANTKIRIAELEGHAGLLVEQVRVLERIRKSGGLFTQKGKYVFFLLESCNTPPVGSSWKDYENLFLSFIIHKNEHVEVINANCEKDEFSIKKLKAEF